MKFIQDIGMEFGMLIMENGKRQITEGIELSNQEKIRTLDEKENYKYLWILEADTIKQAEMEGKKKKVPQTNCKAFRNLPS